MNSVNELCIKFYTRNYYLECWKSRNPDVTYLQFFDWLKKSGVPMVQSAYDIWRNLCHFSLSQDPNNLAVLNEVYEVFLKLENNVLKSFENENTQDLVKIIKEICNFPDSVFSTVQSVLQVFHISRRYWSFCSCDLLHELIEIYGTDEDKQMLQYYQMILYDHIYKCQIAQLPLNIYGNLYLTNENTKDLIITVEMDRDSIAVGHICYVHAEFAKVFSVHPCQMHFLQMSGNDSGDYNLHFLACHWIADDFLDIPQTAESTLAQLHIINFSVGQCFEVILNPIWCHNVV